MALSTGMVVSMVYGSSHLLLLFILSIYIYIQFRQSSAKSSFKNFILALWKERGVYSPALIHIYDTATDIGVLYEWYRLAQMEKNGTNLESLDMVQFFAIAMCFMLAYRFLLGCGGAIFFGMSAHGHKKGSNWSSSACSKLKILGAAFVGFLLGSMELVVFVGIFVDFKDKKKLQQKKGSNNAERGAGKAQKACQSSEGVLESLPEVIMQSVFYMRAINDERLNAAAGDIVYLVAFSIAASMLSITSKYVWVDEYMVKKSTKALVIKKDDPQNDGILMGGCCCVRGYNISYGYIIRVMWRLAAVIARFVIIALVWVVLGGYIEFVLIPVMVLLWYILLFFYATHGNFKGSMRMFLKLAKEIYDSEWKDRSCLWRCWVILAIIIGFVCIFIGGVILQLGIAVMSGAGIYIIRIIENFILMIIITVFATLSFDCVKCADPNQRVAFGPDGNARILLWVFVGWTAIIIHTITSCLMPKVMRDDYDFNVEDAGEKLRKEMDINKIKTATMEEYESQRRKFNVEFAKQPHSKNILSKARLCECGDKFVPMKAGWIQFRDYRQHCYYLEACHKRCELNDIAWYCESDVSGTKKHSRADIKVNGGRLKYILCEECVVKEADGGIQAMEELIKSEEISPGPLCVCGAVMIPDSLNNVGSCYCADCDDWFVWSAWSCPTGKTAMHQEGYYLCVKCGAKDEHFDKSKVDYKKIQQIEIMVELSKQFDGAAPGKDNKSLPNCPHCQEKLVPTTQKKCRLTNATRRCTSESCRYSFYETDLVWHCGSCGTQKICMDCGMKAVDAQNNDKTMEEKQMETMIEIGAQKSEVLEVIQNDKPKATQSNDYKEIDSVDMNDKSTVIEEEEAGNTGTGIELVSNTIEENVNFD